jgi:hypothetical protein
MILYGNKLPPQTSSPWCAICPSHGVGSMDRANPTQKTSPARVYQRCCCLILYKMIHLSKAMTLWREHSLLNVTICKIANRWCRIQLEVEYGSLNLKRFALHSFSTVGIVTKIPLMTDTTSPTNIIAMVCHLPLPWGGIYGSGQSDTENLSCKGLSRALLLGFI